MLSRIPTRPNTRKHPGHRAGNSSAVVVTALACFALLLGSVFWSSTTETVQQVKSTPQLQSVPETVTATPVDQQSDEIVAVAHEIEANSADAVVVAEQQAEQPAAAANRADIVAAQLAAGEFGPALATANSATDAEEPPPADPLGSGPLWTFIIIAAAVLVALEWAAYHRRVTV